MSDIFIYFSQLIKKELCDNFSGYFDRILGEEYFCLSDLEFENSYKLFKNYSNGLIYDCLEV